MILMTGTVMAQAIGYLISPILTRIYTPEQMGDLGVYMRAISFLSALASARYELSLPLPKSDSHSYLLYRLSLRIALYTLAGSVLVSLIYLITKSFDLNEVLFISITLISSFFLVFINLGTNWAIRKKQFRKISNSRVINSLTSNGLRWVFGLFSWGSWGLLLGTLIGYIASSLTFMKEYFSIDKTHRISRSRKKTFALVSEYRQFPMVSLPHVLIDLGRDLLVATLIIYFFSKDIFGSYSHSYTILRLPIMVIGTSIGQVFFNRCSEMVNRGESIYQLLRRTTLLLLAVSIPAFSVIYFFGEPLFGFVFGDNWLTSGYYSEIMSFWLMTNFIASPLSTIPIVVGKQSSFFKLGLVLTFFQLIAFGVLPLFTTLSKEVFESILWIASISQGIILIITIFFILHYARIFKAPLTT